MPNFSGLSTPKPIIPQAKWILWELPLCGDFRVGICHQGEPTVNVKKFALVALASTMLVATAAEAKFRGFGGGGGFRSSSSFSSRSYSAPKVVTPTPKTTYGLKPNPTPNVTPYPSSSSSWLPAFLLGWFAADVADDIEEDLEGTAHDNAGQED
ncbi:hypothetical protein [Ensifer aridi]|uniref:hypothetical protein n=1 Tax=Ensifer aridi TaxID=1708715 RepID=UPI00111C4618|nr:hypothetical protein [Ensifer aridi]